MILSFTGVTSDHPKKTQIFILQFTEAENYSYKVATNMRNCITGFSVGKVENHCSRIRVQLT